MEISGLVVIVVGGMEGEDQGEVMEEDMGEEMGENSMHQAFFRLKSITNTLW
jgi:hypothetical protein